MTVTGLRRRPPQPVPRSVEARTTLWCVATVTGRPPGPFTAGQHVVISGPGATRHATAFTVIGPTGAGALTRATVRASALRVLPGTYRVRPCTGLCGLDGDCWLVQAPGAGRAHHATLHAAMGACVTHYARTTR